MSFKIDQNLWMENEAQRIKDGWNKICVQMSIKYGTCWHYEPVIWLWLLNLEQTKTTTQ